jgi:hypothetical protein
MAAQQFELAGARIGGSDSPRLKIRKIFRHHMSI